MEFLWVAVLGNMPLGWGEDVTFLSTCFWNTLQSYLPFTLMSCLVSFTITSTQLEGSPGKNLKTHMESWLGFVLSTCSWMSKIVIWVPVIQCFVVLFVLIFVKVSLTLIVFDTFLSFFFSPYKNTCTQVPSVSSSYVKGNSTKLWRALTNQHV